MIDRLIISSILFVIFLFPAGAFAQPGNNMGFMTLPESSSSTLPTPTPSPFNRFTPMYVDSTCFFYGPPGCEDTSGIYYHDRETGKTYKPLPYRNGIPVCHDPLFEMGALGSTCYDEGDPTDPEDYRPIAEECEEVGGYSLSKGSYIQNGAIVGSPCNPVLR